MKNSLSIVTDFILGIIKRALGLVVLIGIIWLGNKYWEIVKIIAFSTFVIVVVAIILFCAKGYIDDKRNNRERNAKLRNRAENGDVRAMVELSNRFDKGLSASEAAEWGQRAREIIQRREIKREQREQKRKQRKEELRRKYQEIVSSKINND